MALKTSITFRLPAFNLKLSILILLIAKKKDSEAGKRRHRGAQTLLE
jgi:hypothetical protein